MVVEANIFCKATDWNTATGGQELREMSLPLTVIGVSGRGDGAGPPTTLPSSIENMLPWQVQLMVPSVTLSSGQP